MLHNIHNELKTTSIVTTSQPKVTPTGDFGQKATHQNHAKTQKQMREHHMEKRVHPHFRKPGASEIVEAVRVACGSTISKTPNVTVVFLYFVTCLYPSFAAK